MRKGGRNGEREKREKKWRESNQENRIRIAKKRAQSNSNPLSPPLLSHLSLPRRSIANPRYTFTLLDCVIDRVRSRAFFSMAEAACYVNAFSLASLVLRCSKRHSRYLPLLQSRTYMQTHTYTHTHTHTHNSLSLSPACACLLFSLSIARKTVWFTHNSEQRSQSQYEYALSRSVSASERY